MKKIKLKPNEQIIAVVPDTYKGVGEARVIWVYILNSMTHNLRIDSLQEEEFTDQLKVYFTVGELVCNALIKMVPVELDRGEK